MVTVIAQLAWPKQVLKLIFKLLLTSKQMYTCDNLTCNSEIDNYCTDPDLLMHYHI